MYQNHLRMNDTNTEYTLFGNRTQLVKCFMVTIEVGPEDIPAGTSMKYLGVIIDPQLTLKSHIKMKVSKAMSNLIKLRKLRQFLSTDSTKQLMSALILSHLDYANGILVNLPAVTIRPMQVVQNFAARVTMRRGRECDAMVCLRHLHWLLIHARSIFKILTMVFRCLEGTALGYLASRIKVKKCMKVTRQTTFSVQSKMLEVPFNKCRTFGNRAFSFTGPYYWNTLPLQLRQMKSLYQFKRELKTYLFRQYL
eukprot:GHVT01080830.1.p1 GENE.GHVT01080830.1~~GHVT01080830.1.p1  ORF type:complete len:252 (-),score=-15.59 GHVT01080830.1:192-947(-)